ncbi:MAG: hypothetical protein Q9M26_05130 [Mariprofundales bacterium]|nr:hypothetical protein [Mariprofundales bacterium]
MGLHCRRRPNHQPCPGEIAATIDPSDNHIYWECPICGDQGRIHHWEETLWDCRETVPARIETEDHCMYARVTPHC